MQMKQTALLGALAMAFSMLASTMAFAENCVYESKEYSPGSRVEMSVMECQGDGTWKPV